MTRRTDHDTQREANWATATLAVHAGQHPDPTTGAVMTPVYLTSTYAQESPGVHKGYEYSRTSNPTREALERCLAALEGAQHGFAFASGCAAASTLMHLFEAGDHIVCSDDLYGGTWRLFEQVWTHHDLHFSFVDLTDPEALARSVGPRTRGVWIETPTNPLLKLVDIEAVAGIAHARGLLLMVDNTFATPFFQRPLDLGADVVVHSTTKYLGGHSDVVGGFVGTNRDDLAERIGWLLNATGAVPGPLDCFLVLRGTKTLGVRMERHAANALAVAEHLRAHPGVERVIFPGLDDYPQRALAERQMKGPGGIVTFVLRGGLEAARRFMEALEVFTCAESLGGVESLADHPAIMTHATVPVEQRQALGIDDGLIRLSVGIEAVEDLLADLDRALRAAAA